MGNRSPEDLAALIRSSRWLMSILRTVRACALPDWLVGAGAVRDLVWSEMHGGADYPGVKDVDVVFFNPHDLSPTREQQAEAALRAHRPDVRWDVKNQAAVHLWYERRFGLPVEPLTSSADGVATWPETATAVAARLGWDDAVETVAPCGVDDLLDGVCRWNPRRVTKQQYRERVRDKRFAQRWPRVRILDT